MNTDSEKPASVTAVVLGAGSSDDPIARLQGVTAKSHYVHDGKLLGEWVLEALKASSLVSHTIFVGPAHERLVPLADRLIPGGQLFSESVRYGTEAALAATPGARILIVTADLPWLQADAVDRFIASAPGALNYPVVRAEDMQRAFPDQKRTFVRLAMGQVTGGNVALMNPEVVPALLRLAERFYTARKNPLQLSSLLGIGTIFDLLTGRAQLAKLEARVSRLLGAPARAIVTQDAGLAADLDKLEEVIQSSASGQ